MNGSKLFELKVGVFVLIGIAIVFIIVFSIGDITLSRSQYHITVLFDFAHGIGSSAPVRLAGVSIGQVEAIKIHYGEKDRATRAELILRLDSTAKIEEDAKITINMLGFLGEKYVEIFPGTPGKPLLTDGVTVTGVSPVPMERVTANLARLLDMGTDIVQRLKNGEGTLGKLLNDPALYNDLDGVFGKLNRGEGTLGKLLVEEKVYNDLATFTGMLSSKEGTLGKLLNDPGLYDNLEEFTADIKKHPWKLLSKPRGED